MSRIGKMPIILPETVKVEVKPSEVVLSGPKGSLTLSLRPEVKVTLNNGALKVEIKKENKISRSLHGLTRSLLQNIVTGLTVGFERRLELVGTGYRVQPQDKNLKFSLGFSHDVVFEAPAGVTLTAVGQNKVVVAGIDKQLVGQMAANIRALRPPEPYKGKGIRYEGETIRRKVGKQAKAAE